LLSALYDRYDRLSHSSLIDSLIAAGAIGTVNTIAVPRAAAGRVYDVRRGVQVERLPAI
jgi:hypothetical protein